MKVFTTVLVAFALFGLAASAQTTPAGTGLTSVGASGTSSSGAVSGIVAVGSTNGIPCYISGTVGSGGKSGPFGGTLGNPVPNSSGVGSTYTLQLEQPSSGGNLGVVGVVSWNSANPNALSFQGVVGTGPGNSFPISIK